MPASTTLAFFARQRTAAQAVIFYCIVFLLFVLCATLLGGLAALLPLGNADPFTTGLRVGTGFSIVGCLLLGSIVAHAKGLMTSPVSLGIVLLSGVLALLGGSLLGLIPIAYLTTRPSLPVSDTKSSNLDAIQKSTLKK